MNNSYICESNVDANSVNAMEGCMVGDMTGKFGAIHYPDVRSHIDTTFSNVGEIAGRRLVINEPYFSSSILDSSIIYAGK